MSTYRDDTYGSIPQAREYIAQHLGFYLSQDADILAVMQELREGTYSYYAGTDNHPTDYFPF